MNRLHKRRLIFITVVLLGVGSSIAVVLYALKQNINVFYTPTQVMQDSFSTRRAFRMGGVIKNGSVERSKNDLNVKFIVSDGQHAIPVEYNGILPDLFREGKGIVVAGNLNAQGIFIATEVLAKHDERYVPPGAY